MKESIWIINYFAGHRHSGWGERHFFLAKELIKKGYDVQIISSSYNHLFKQLPDAPHTFNFETVEGVRFCWVKSPKYKPESIFRFLSMIIFTLKLFFLPFHRFEHRPTFIIVSSMPMFPILPATFFKRKCKAKKLVFEVRDLWPLTPVYLGKVSKLNPMIVFMRMVERFAYKRSDLIISLLPRAGKHINAITNNPDKLLHLPNGISEEVYSAGDLPFELKGVIPADKFVVGYAGTIGIANAMEYVVGAAQLLASNPRIYFVILGDGYKKPELLKKAARLSNITFLPKVKKGYVSKVIAYFDLSIISWHKSPLYDFGVSANKYFDYMLAAKPILGAGNLADDPISIAQCGRIVEPENPEAIKQAILDFASLSKLQLMELGMNGRRYVEKYHSYEYLSNKLINALHA